MNENVNLKTIEDYHNELATLISQGQPITYQDVLSALTTPPDPTMGDLALPCFKFSKQLRKSPEQIANLLHANVLNVSFLEKVEVQGGYLNFYFNKPLLVRLCLEPILKNPNNLVKNRSTSSDPIVIEYSSPNVAKPFHVGHLGSTIIGESLARIYEKTGHSVYRLNHLGDWGVQNGYQVLSFERRKDEFKDRLPNIDELCQLYVWINEQAKQEPDIDLQARLIFKSLEDGDLQYQKTWKLFLDVTIQELEKTYETLGIRFDKYQGESYYIQFVDGMLKTMREKPNYLEESEGALVVRLDEYDIKAPCILIKSDGATNYATRDLASAIWRKNELHFQKNIIVTDVSQSHHFQQVFASLKKFGYEWASDCEHISYGLMNLRNDEGEIVPMKTRQGTMIPLSKLMQRMNDILLSIIVEKNPNLEEKEMIAKVVSINAIKFWIQSKQRNMRVLFDWQEATNPQGVTGTYLNYTYARASSILRKLPETVRSNLNPEKISTSIDPKELALALKLNEFDSQVAKALAEQEPSVISIYLIAIAQCFNTFYFSQKVVSAETPELMHDRACLVKATQTIMKQAMYLIGMDTVEQM